MVKFISLISILAVCLSSCTALRAIRCGTPTTDSYTKFTLDTIRAIGSTTPFIDSPQNDPLFRTTKFNGGQFHHETISEYFKRVRGNGSLLIVRNDSILLEEYYGNVQKHQPSNIFSISKAITALLCGIAIDEGYISSVNDPVTNYLPELLTADPRFSELTIEHLLDMRSGLDFKEEYGWNPFSKMAKLYYGDDVLNFISKAKFNAVPGTRHHYNSLATAILGVVIERATSQSYAHYLQTKVWIPLGMESDAYVTLDSKTSHHAKAYGGIATDVRNLALIGRLYMNGGKHDGKQIVSPNWIKRSINASLDNEAYSYGWNNIISKNEDGLFVTSRFFALGLFGQILFCDPEQNIIFVTLGEEKGCDYHLLFDDFCNILKQSQ